MHIQCTKKMLDFLKPEITLKNTDDDFYAWHANYIVIERKKLMIFMNDLTRYCVVLYGLKKSDFKDPVILFRSSILLTMATQKYPPELIEEYISKIHEVTYGKTKDRKLVARLNRAAQDSWWYCQDGLYFGNLLQPHISNLLNESPVGQDHWKIVYYPVDKMYEYLQTLSGSNLEA